MWSLGSNKSNQQSDNMLIPFDHTGIILHKLLFFRSPYQSEELDDLQREVLDYRGYVIALYIVLTAKILIGVVEVSAQNLKSSQHATEDHYREVYSFSWRACWILFLRDDLAVRRS
jgi:hypothetical protein